MASPVSSIFLWTSFAFLSFIYCVYGGRETVESRHILQFHTVQLSSLLPASVCKSSSKDKASRSTLKVVHKHGPCSQLVQDSANVPTHSQLLEQDQSRVDSLHSRLSRRSSKGQNLETSKAKLPAKSGASLGTGNYIVTVGLGTPRKDLSVIFDTGSDLTWTQCQPCASATSCYKQAEPMFNPAQSSTYSNLTCDSAQCSQLTSATGNPPRCAATTCVYGIQYGDQSFSKGFYGKERLTLTPTDVFDNFFFGCGQDNDGLFGGAAGLLGLGRNQISLVSQTSTKYGRLFSYCLPPTSSSTGYLSFGSGATSSTKFTPLYPNSQNPSFYFIELTGISVGGQKLAISPAVFSTAGTIIDSGTVITRLPPTAYSSLRSTFRQMMSQYPMAQPLSLLDTCYDFSKYSSVSIPKISLFFGGGTEVSLDVAGTVYGSKSQLCLAFAGNSDDGDVAIFGNRQQVTFAMVYDDAGKRLGFGQGGCS